MSGTTVRGFGGCDGIPETAFGEAYDFFWEPENGEPGLGKSHYITVQGYADIPAAGQNYSSTGIPMRDGELVESKSYRSNIEITCNIAIDLSNDRELSIRKVMRDLKVWLTGKGRLSFTDNAEAFYEVLQTLVSGLTQEMPYFGTATVTFLARPSEYIREGLARRAASKVIFNPYCRCHPVYEIYGEGVCELVVNGVVVTANVGQNLCIDTDRQLSYRTDGTSMNTAVKCDYTKLWLDHGKVAITATEGFEVYVIPRWEVPA